MARSRKAAGTSLVEVLVVIVVFLVGILAVIQIFPKGIRLLVMSKNSAVATALGRSEVERLKAHPDQLPEGIFAVKFDGTNVFVDTERDPSNLGPQADSLTGNGHLYLAGNDLGLWPYLSGANGFRRIVGETKTIPAPRDIGNDYGGMLLLNFGPVKYDPTLGADITIYGNAMLQIPGRPSSTRDINDNVYFIGQPDSSSASLILPSGPVDRYYHVSFAAYVGGKRIDYVDTPPIKVDATTPIDGVNYPTQEIPFSNIISTSIQGVEPSSVQVARRFVQVANTDVWGTDPYTYKLIDSTIGSVLFNPAAFNVRVEKAGGGYEPLVARVNYDVLDWRILREEIRLDTSGGQVQFQLAVGGLKVGGQSGPDGLPLGGIYLSEPTETSDPRADHFVMVDMLTGGVFYEKTKSGTQLIQVNKSTGVVTMTTSDPKQTVVTGDIFIAPKTKITVPLQGRAVKVLYMVRNEVSVQVLMAAAKYALVPVKPGPAQCYPGQGGVNGLPTRLYFAKSENGRKVILGNFTYLDGGGYVHEIQGQDFVIGYPLGNDPLGLPCIDLTEMDPNATSFGAIRDIKGASVSVRVLWNPDAFHLGNDSVANMKAFDVWGRSWRRNTTETYLQQEARR